MFNVMTNITIDTHQVFKTLTDMIWDMSSDLENTESQVDTMMGLLPHFYDGDMDGIRQSFKDGFSFLLIPEYSEVLDGEGEIEIRVHHRGHLIGVVINSEINY